jgi:glycosyltransferase involved in cell wall biosynthesis
LIRRPVPILLLVRELGPGGSERQLAEVAKGLDRTRFFPHVAFFREGFRLRELIETGVPCVRLPVSSFLKPGAVLEAFRLFRYLRAHGIQLVHTFDYPLSCFAVPVARAAKVPVILSSQRSYRSLIPKPFLPIIRWTDSLVDGIVVNCRAIEQHLIQTEGVPPSKILLAFNAINLSQFYPCLREVDSSGESRTQVTIGSVAVLRPEKCLDLMIEAFANVAASLPSINLALLGSGPEEQRLKRLAQQRGILDRCRFESAQNEVGSFLRSIDIFVLPSSSEALSNSLMEAMACGCAVIASNVGGNPELVTDGVNGLLFPAGDLEELTCRIRQLILDKPLRQQLSINAAATVRERFTVKGTLGTISSIYDSLLNQNVDP